MGAFDFGSAIPVTGKIYGEEHASAAEDPYIFPPAGKWRASARLRPERHSRHPGEPSVTFMAHFQIYFKNTARADTADSDSTATLVRPRSR